MKGRAFLAAIAIGLGVLGTGALYYGQQLTTKVVPVVVAARNVKAREILTKEDLKIAMVNAAAVDPLAVRDPAQLLGKVLISPVFQGEQIRPQRVNPDELQLATDEVAVAFPTDLASAVGGLLQAGDLVDVYLSFNPATTKRSDVLKVAEGIKVLSVRDSAAKATGPKANADPAKTTAGTPAVVVVKIPKDRVEQMRQAANAGTLIFAQRSPDAPAPEKALFPAVALPKMDAVAPGTAPLDPAAKESTKGR